MDDPSVLGPPFSEAQRLTLFAASGGVCARCCKPLASIEEAHADHKVPRALGGQTTIMNGQILCPDCNLKKGKKMDSILHATRDWQVRCLASIETAKQNGARDFIANVPPASGKTRVGVELGYQMLAAAEIDFVVIVAPSIEIRRSWVEQAEMYPNPRPGRDPTRNHMRFGLEFEANTYLDARYDGAVVTYQWLSLRPEVLADLCRNTRVLFIADEIHHSAMGQSWGDAIHDSTNDAVFRLGMSGTPFRTDSGQIPFLHYTDGQSLPHFTYGLAEALEQGVVAPPYFRWVTGSVEVPEDDGAMRMLSLDESVALEDDEEGRLLTRIVTPSADDARGFVHCLLDAANAELLLQKQTDPTSAGLVIAVDIRAAEAIAKYLGDLGASVELVTSDPAHNGSRWRLQAFKNNGMDWLVSVDMVSEGVDIPRLKVLAYLTNERTEMRFRQGIGRIMRLQPGRNRQEVFAYLPKLHTFETYAKEIEQDRRHVLGDEEPEPPVMPGGASNGEARPPRQWTVADNGALVLRSDGYIDGLTYSGRHFTEKNIDDVIALSGHTPKAQNELAQIGRTLWAGTRLTALAEVAEEDGQTIDAFLAERLARRAAPAQAE